MLAIQLKLCLGYSSNQPPPAEMPQFPAFSDGSKASTWQAGTAIFYRFLCESYLKLHSSVPEDVLSWLTHPIGESLMDKFDTFPRICFTQDSGYKPLHCRGRFLPKHCHPAAPWTGWWGYLMRRDGSTGRMWKFGGESDTKFIRPLFHHPCPPMLLPLLTPSLFANFSYYCFTLWLKFLSFLFLKWNIYV